MIGRSDFLWIKTLDFGKNLFNMSRLIKTPTEIERIVPVKMRLLSLVLQNEMPILLWKWNLQEIIWKLDEFIAGVRVLDTRRQLKMERKAIGLRCKFLYENLDIDIVVKEHIINHKHKIWVRIAHNNLLNLLSDLFLRPFFLNEMNIFCFLELLWQFNVIYALEV